MKTQAKRAAKRVLVCALAVMVTAGVFADGGYYAKERGVVHAEKDSAASSEAAKNDAAIASQESDIADLEQKQAELDQKIKNAEAQENAEQEKQQAVREQISTVESTMHKLADTITEREQSIAKTQEAIAANQAAIEEKKGEIEEGMVELKKRLRVMYVAGNDTYSEILIGASDFYDMLMKIEMIKRVAKHDNDLIDGLMELKGQYESEEKELNDNMEKLESDLKDLESRREKQQAQVKKLEGLYAESALSLEMLASDKEIYEKNKAQYAKEQQQFEEDLQKLFEERQKIAEKEAAEKKAKEEAEKKAKEEAEKKRKQEEKKKKEQQQQQEQQEQQDQQQNDTTPDQSYTEPEPDDDPYYYDDGDDDYGSDDSSSESDSSSQDDSSSSSSGGTDPNSAYGYTPKSRFTWPVPGYYNISYGVGWRWGAYHQGIDIWSEGIRGHNIIAADAGTVIVASNTCTHDYGKDYSCGCGGGYGNYCIIDHGNGYWTLYGHSEGITVSEGQYVEKGDVLGTVGSTGYSTGAHLHFEVRINGVAQDPQDYV